MPLIFCIKKFYLGKLYITGKPHNLQNVFKVATLKNNSISKLLSKRYCIIISFQNWLWSIFFFFVLVSSCFDTSSPVSTIHVCQQDCILFQNQTSLIKLLETNCHPLKAAYIMVRLTLSIIFVRKEKKLIRYLYFRVFLSTTEEHWKMPKIAHHSKLRSPDW